MVALLPAGKKGGAIVSGGAKKIGSSSSGGAKFSSSGGGAGAQGKRGGAGARGRRGATGKKTIGKEPVWSSGTTSKGEYLSAGDRKAAFKKSKISSEVFKKSSPLTTGLDPVSEGEGTLDAEKLNLSGSGSDVTDALEKRISANESKITKIKNILQLKKKNEPGEEIAEAASVLEDIGNALSADFAHRITQEQDAVATLRGTADRKKRSGAEAGIEAVKKIGSTLGKSLDVVAKPAQNILDKVIGFFGNLAAGFLADKAITWLGNNPEGVTKFFKFLQNHGKKLLIGLGALVGGVLIFKVVKKIRQFARFAAGVFKGLNRARRIGRVFMKRTLPKMLKNAKAAVAGVLKGIKAFAKGIPGVGKVMKLGKNIIKGGKNVIKGVGKGAKALGKGTGKLLKSGGKGLIKKLGKGGAKSLLKKIPIVGLGLGAAFAVSRLMSKPPDWKGALGEMASGAASMIPGVGTGLSLAIDAGMMVRDSKMEAGADREGGDVKDAMGDYTKVVDTIANKEKGLNFDKSGLSKGNLKGPDKGGTTVMDPITVADQVKAKSGGGALGGEEDTIPIVDSEDNSNYYIEHTKEQLGIFA